MLIAIKGKQVIDGTGRDPIPHGILLVERETIRAIGSPEEVPIPAGAEVIDLGQDTILPELVDAHSH